MGAGGDVVINGGNVTASTGSLSNAGAFGVGNLWLDTNLPSTSGGTFRLEGGIVTVPEGSNAFRSAAVTLMHVVINGGLLEIKTRTSARPIFESGNGNLSQVNWGWSTGRDEHGTELWPIRVLLYSPDGQEQFGSENWYFPAHTEVTFHLYEDDVATTPFSTITSITDSEGRLFVFLPAGSEGTVGRMTMTGSSGPVNISGTLLTMTTDASSLTNNRFVFVVGGGAPPPEDEWPSDPVDPNDPQEPEYEGPLWLHLGPNSPDGIYVGINGMSTLHLGGPDGDLIGRVDVRQPSSALIRPMLDILDHAISHVSDARAALGAIQNRLEFTVQNIGIAGENLSASESRIRDADMAAEMMELTQVNVLQQAATSMLAQANQAPTNVLQLLQ
jgi:flagellin-like hook-associated protein FlgL